MATNWDHLRWRSYSRDECDRVGMLRMYNDSVCASYTTIPRLYHQNRYGDAYLIAPQDLDWVE
jgi:hypothetical protein